MLTTLFTKIFDSFSVEPHHLSLWLEMGNLNHLPFGMILNLDIGLLHPSRLLRHKISQKKWKRPKKFFWRPHQRPDRKIWFFIIFFECHIKDHIEKKMIFLSFFALTWSNLLRKFSQCLWVDLQGHKEQNDHTKVEYL